jgi:hypothetical protein
MTLTRFLREGARGHQAPAPFLRLLPPTPYSGREGELEERLGELTIPSTPLKIAKLAEPYGNQK